MTVSAHSKQQDRIRDPLVTIVAGLLAWKGLGSIARAVRIGQRAVRQQDTTGALQVHLSSEAL